MESKDEQRLHVTIKGRVQGVGFRYFVAENAQRLGLCGWVRNRWDGSVEVLAEGPRADLEKLLSALRRGPTSSYVNEANPQWEFASGEFTGFHVRTTS